jgi:hypothetical protein
MSRFLAVWCALALGLGCGSDDTGVKLDSHAKPVERAKVRAFYSGHSLLDGVPAAVASFAPSLAAHGKPTDFDYEFQSGTGSLIVTRGMGVDPNAAGAGYRFGRNRNGEGLDVAAELREPRTLAAGDRYNVLVITERHDLPWTIANELTVPALKHFTDTFQAANPDGEVLLYHGWLSRNDGPITDWIDYERDALPLWECVASAINRKLPADKPKLRVLPGATALVALVESILEREAPGVALSQAELIALLFSDDVHLTPVGTYFISLVHYAALFGVSPEGAAAPQGVSPALARHMQKLAWKHVADYAKRAVAAASRDMALCREYAEGEMCPRYYQYRKPAGGTLVDRASHMKNALFCDSGAAFVE